MPFQDVDLRKLVPQLADQNVCAVRRLLGPAEELAPRLDAGASPSATVLELLTEILVRTGDAMTSVLGTESELQAAAIESFHAT